MRVLKLIGVSLWKEWRDHKVMLIAIAIALPVLTAIAFWAFGEHLIGSTVRTQLLIFLPVALGLVFFSIAADLVSGEKRRNTLDLIRRMPGGLARTFAIKWCFLLVVSLGAMLYQGALLAWAWEWMAEYGKDGGYGGYNISSEIHQQMGAFPESWFWQLALVGMVLPPWAFVVSTWLGRSGAAAIASLLVLGGILAPWGLMLIEHPWFFPFDADDMPTIVAVVVGMAVLVSAISYLGGLRYHGAVWKPGIYGLVAVLVLSGAGYGYAHVELHRYLDFDQHDPDMRIRGALVSDGGERIYLNVHKGHPWQAGKPVDGHQPDAGGLFGKHKGTPVQTWIYEVETDTVTRDSNDGKHHFGPVDYNASSRWDGGWILAPHKVVTRSFADRDEMYELRWIDARTNEVIDTFDKFGTRSAAVSEAIREDARFAGYHVDSQNRRVWIRDGELERDGALIDIPDRIHVVSQGNVGWVIRNPVGWTTYKNLRDEKNRFTRTAHYFINAESGETSEMTIPDVEGRRYSFPGSVLDGEISVRPVKRKWVVLNFNTGEIIGEAKNPPLQILQVVLPRRALATYYDADGNVELRLWNPVSGETWPMTIDTGPLSKDSSFQTTGRSADGRYLTTALVTKEGKHHYWIGVADPRARTIRTIATGEGWPWTHIRPLVLGNDDSLVAIENDRRIVRIGPEPDAKQVIFPRSR